MSLPPPPRGKRRELAEPSPAKLVVAATWGARLDEKTVRGSLARVFGEIAEATPPFSFVHTRYYEQEMGGGLAKSFMAFGGFFSRSDLVEIKHKATRLEDAWLGENGGRRLNVDPMLVTPENVVIATSKNFAHRAYLGKGVFADVAFSYRYGRFEAYPWTYADYSERAGFFENVRKQLFRPR